MALSESPRLAIVAGPNGAGKSTLVRVPRALTLLAGVQTLNPDDFARRILADSLVSLDEANLRGVQLAEAEAWRAVVAALPPRDWAAVADVPAADRLGRCAA